MRILVSTISIPLAFFFVACSAQKSISPGLQGAPEPQDARNGVYHVVERHQTLYRICKTYGVNLNRVAALNGLADPGSIRAGQRIFIPGAKAPRKVELHLNDVANEQVDRGNGEVPSGPLKFLWPAEGQLGQLFEERGDGGHRGIDILCPPGTPIQAAAPGMVLYSGNGIRGYGNLVMLRHSEGWISLYAHNEVNLVEEGIWVDAGQVIGKVGQTGKASRPHLHFEIRRNNRALDPLLFLKYPRP